VVALAERADPAAEGGRPGRTRIGGNVRVELAIAIGLALLAILPRLPYLWEVPRFTDELQEILWALAISRGEISPLTAVDSYYGPLWSYLLAGAFRLGADPELAPRALATLLAAATVGLSYLVASDMAGRWAGLVTAALLTTSGGHVVINSHTARSNSITPLMTTAAIWLLFRACRAGNGWLLVACGLLFGLALQTHVSVIALAPGMALGLLLLRPRLGLSRWAPLAAASFLLGYGNMILFNLQTGFWSLIHARQLQEGYAGGRSTDPARYLENLAALVQSLSRLLSGTIEEADHPARFLYIGLALIGLILAARRGNPLPLAVCASCALVLPYFNPRYGPILSGRYLIPMLPFAYLGIALAVHWLASWLPLRPRLRTLAMTAAALVLVVFPLVRLAGYYEEVLADGRTNRPLFALADAVQRGYRAGDLVLLDEALAQEPLTAGGTDLKAMRFLLEARSIPYQVAKLGGAAGPISAAQPSALVVMEAKKRPELRRTLDVTSLSAEIESASGSGHRYAVYRLVPRSSAGG
jgi:4-amino-4-deoxy-L-arabinose transferase-like glycosyltransferase